MGGEARLSFRAASWSLFLAAVLLVPVFAGADTRVGSSTVSTQSSPGYIGSPIVESTTDPNGNGLVDAIVLTVPFVVNDSGYWTWYASLFVGPDFASGNYSYDYRSAGTYNVDMAFTAWTIRRLQTDGPYTVVVQMYADAMGFLTSVNHTTAAYGWRSLEFLIEIQALAERPIDADGDGLYNYLEVSGNLNVTSSLGLNRTRIEGRVYDQGGTYAFAYLYNNSSPSIGVTAFDWRFSGDAIQASGVNGIYRITLTVEEFGNYGIYQTSTLFTRSYAANQFFHRPIVITGPLVDYGLDFDGNGLYDVLRIDVPIAVNLSGVYHVSGEIWTGSYAYVSGYTTLSLSVGDSIAHMDLDGFAVRNTIVSPTSFQIELSILEDRSPYYVSASGTTAVYQSSDFDNPYANIVGLRVTPRDANGDGEFDDIEVNATVHVKTAATLGGYFGLQVGSDFLDSYFTVKGEPGLLSVATVFPGWRLRASGWNGTYRFWVALYSPHGEFLDGRGSDANFTFDQFARALRLRGPVTLEGVDTDGDLRFNRLIVHIPLRVEVEGLYYLAVGGRDQFRNGTGNSRTRYLDPGDVDLAIPLSGVALSSLAGPTLNVTFYAALSVEFRGPFTVMESTTSFGFDPNQFQTVQQRTVAFRITGGEPIGNSYLELRNYSDAIAFRLFPNSTNEVAASLPDVQYDMLVVTYARSISYRFYGQVFALPNPLPDRVDLYLTRPEDTERSDAISFTDWSTGASVTEVTLAPYGAARFAADGNIDPDGYVTLEEIANLAEGYRTADVLPSIWVDGTPVRADLSGEREPFGEGPVVAGIAPGFRQPFVLTGVPVSGSSHRVRVDVFRGYAQLQSRATVRIPEGWNVTAIEAPSGVHAVRTGPRDVSIEAVDIQPTPYSVNITATALTSVPDSSPRIDGTVRNALGQPVSGATARLWQGTVPVATQVSGVDGRFSFGSLPAGTYVLNVTAAGYWPYEITETLPEGEHVYVTVNLEPTSKVGSISGRVVDPEGHGISGATVDLFQGTAVIAEVVSDSEGGLSFMNVTAGSFSVRVEATGFGGATVPATVVGHSPSSVGEIVLQRAVSGRGFGPDAFLLPLVVGIVLAAAGTTAALLLWRRRSKHE